MNTILEIALGLVFVFLLFSLLVSAVNEAIFGHLTHLRARVLEDSLHAILSKQAKGFSAWAWLRRGCKAPLSAGTGVFSEQLLKHPLVQGLVTGKQRCPGYLSAETFVHAVLGTLFKLGAAQPDQANPPDLARAVNNLSDGHARNVLGCVLAGCKNLDEARQRLEAWFNNSMQRVSGAYKRYTQFWLYVWATLIVFWLNVDTIEIGQRLIADAQYRGVLAAGALSFVAQAAATNGSALPAQPATDAPIAPPPQTKLNVSTLSMSELLTEINKLNLPIGWGACSANATTNSLIGWVMTRLPKLRSAVGVNTNSAAFTLASGALASAAPCPNTPHAWRLKLIGLLITIAAVSQGAPFWFDLLNRVTNLRATGRPPKAKGSNE